MGSFSVDSYAANKKQNRVRIVKTYDGKFFVQYWRKFLFCGCWCNYFWTGCGTSTWKKSFSSKCEALSELKHFNQDRDVGDKIVWESQPNEGG